MGKSLMIVDDSATMRKFIMRTVRLSGLDFERVEEAGTGIEAMAKLQTRPVDVMLCDVNMPQMNGIELVRKARQEPLCRGTKIIMVSTESAPDLIHTLCSDGADGYITKPFTPETFREKLLPLLN